jgi:nucleoside-diphosphate-sugar epimerase
MKILVTGGRGLVGSEIVSNLRKKQMQVLAPTSQELDVLNPQSVSQYISRYQPELLIHSAWYTVHGKFWQSPENENWLRASLLLADEFYRSGGEKFFGLGTCAEYKWDETSICEEGLTKLEPATLYGQKKKQFQIQLMEIAKSYQKPALWGRVFFPFGPGEKPTRVIPLMIRALIQKIPVELSSGLQKRDFLMTEDLGDLIAGLALSSAEGDFNLSSGEALSIREIGKTLCDISGSPQDLLRFSSQPLNEPALIVGSTLKRDRIFPWKAQQSLAQGLEKTFNWWVNQIDK